MECISDITLNTSDVIAVLALLLAGLSALYARWSWYEAKKANQISLFGHKKEIYDAFYELKTYMMRNAEFAEQGEVSKFYYPSRNAKIYLPFNLAKDIEEYFDACFWITKINQKYGGMSEESIAESKQYIDVEKDLMAKIDDAFLYLFKEVQT